MKLRLFFCLALTGLCVFFIQSCTSEFSSSEEIDTASLEIENEDIEIVAPVLYCRYNVATSSNTDKKATGTRVCFPCTKPIKCGRDMDTTIIVDGIKVKVTGKRSASHCVTCTRQSDTILN